MIVLEPGVDGQELIEHGADLANARARERRRERLERALHRILSPPRETIARGQVWQELRRPPLMPCLDSKDVNELFRRERTGREEIRIRRADKHYVFFYRGSRLVRMKRQRLWRFYRRIG